MTTHTFAGQVALVTGASRGIGRAIAAELARQGLKVVGTATTPAGAEAIGASLAAQGGRGVVLDVNDAAGCEAMVESIVKDHGTLHVLVNNAGITRDMLAMRMKDEDWDAVLDTNLKAPWFISKQFTERVAANGQTEGNIVNIASITAYRTIKGQFPYAVSKAAMVKATEVMALEGAKYGIRVNAIAPGYILTDVSRTLLESERSASFVKRIPMRRYGEFEDLDGAMLLLASDASRWMTGSVIVVDGGHICAEL